MEKKRSARSLSLIKNSLSSTQLLGIRLPASSLAALVASVDFDRSGVLEFREFVTVFTRAAAAAAAAQGQQGGGGRATTTTTPAAAAAAIPFHLAFAAYRRRRLLAAVGSGDRAAVAALAAQVEAGLTGEGAGAGGGATGAAAITPARRARGRPAARPAVPSPPPPALTAATWAMLPRPRCC